MAFTNRLPAAVLILPLCLLLFCTMPPLATAADDPSGEDAELLEEHLDIVIQSAARAEVRYLNRTRVISRRGADRYASAAIYHNPSITIRDLEGAVISPAGKKYKVKKKQISDRAWLASYDLYSDAMMRAISFPQVVPGSIVEYSYEQEVRNLHYLPKSFDLQARIPVGLKTLTLRVPEDFPLRVSVRGAEPEYHSEQDGGTILHRWTVRDVPAFWNESDMPPGRDLLPRVSLYPKQFTWDEHRIEASSWSGIALFYWNLSRDRMEPSEEVARMAARLTDGLVQPADKARALFEFAQKEINYVSISLDIGGWQPHPSGEVLHYRYGDCKDKATLAVAMLRSVGLEGYPALIRTRDVGLLDRDNPMLGFNHAILAIPSDDGYMFLDPTDPRTPYGDLPWSDQGVPALVVKRDGVGELIDTPLSPPGRNRRVHRVVASIGAAGNLEGTYTIDVRGQRRVGMASFIDSKPSELEDDLEALIGWLSPGTMLRGHKIIPPSQPDDPLIIEARFEVPRFVTRAGSKEIIAPHVVRFRSLTGMAAYEGRRLPIFFPYLFDESSEVRLDLPAGRTIRQLPQDHAFEGPGLAASTHYEVGRQGEREILIVRRNVTVSSREIGVDEYDRFRAFMTALSEEEAAGMTLIPAD